MRCVVGWSVSRIASRGHSDAGGVAVGQRYVIGGALSALGGSGPSVDGLRHDECRVDGCR